jgi:hypothetical protein
MEMDFDRFKDAASGGPASGGSNAPKTSGGGLSNLESALDEIQRVKEMERRLQEQVGPSFSEQALQLIQDPKIQRAAREIWYGPEEAATSGPPGPAPSPSSSGGVNGGPERAEVTPEVTPEVTDSPESGVTLSDLDPIQGDGSDVTDYQEVETIATGQGVIKVGIATTETGPHRVTFTDGDEIIQYPAPEFMEWAEREGIYDRLEQEENRKREKRQEWYEKVQEWCGSKKEQVLLTLILHEYHGESSVFDDMADIAELLDTSHNYVRKVKSKHSGRATLESGDETIEVTL